MHFFVLTPEIRSYRVSKRAAIVQLNYVGYGIGMVPESGPGYH